MCRCGMEAVVLEGGHVVDNRQRGDFSTRVIQPGSCPATHTKVYPICLLPPTDNTAGVLDEIQADVVSLSGGMGMLNIAVEPLTPCAVLKVYERAS